MTTVGIALLRLLNILNLMLAYLNELNCDRKETEPDNPTSKEMPKL
ncbi:hypothetical protein [Nostoc sp. 'Lobaria pulmonaria (5183) cyanobiont']|nr:hypothetical protein [Nostoc sp. 'Lobaria pulmonaria (5183) cyanobiont']